MTAAGVAMGCGSRRAEPPGVEVRQWGAEGYRVGTIAAAWKGQVYVHGEADDERPALIEILERLVAGFSNGAAGEVSPLSILAPLPVGGRVLRSERYVPADLLGHAFLPGGVLATYEIEGQRAELFFSDLGSEAAAGEALTALREHWSRWGTVDGDVPSIGVGGFRNTDPTPGVGTVVRAGRFVAGIHGELPVEAREGTVGELAAAPDRCGVDLPLFRGQYSAIVVVAVLGPWRTLGRTWEGGLGAMAFA